MCVAQGTSSLEMRVCATSKLLELYLITYYSPHFASRRRRILHTNRNGRIVRECKRSIRRRGGFVTDVPALFQITVGSLVV